MDIYLSKRWRNTYKIWWVMLYDRFCLGVGSVVGRSCCGMGSVVGRSCCGMGSVVGRSCCGMGSSR